MKFSIFRINVSRKPNIKVLASDDRKLIAFGLILCLILLVVLYSRSIASDYAYLGYKFNFQGVQSIFCFVLFFILLFGQSKASSFLGYYVSVLLTLLVFIPNTILTVFDHGYSEIAFASFLFSAAPLFIKNEIKGKVISADPRIFTTLFLSICALMLLYLAFFGVRLNFSLILLDEDVYEGRTKFDSQVASSVIFPYTYSLLTKFMIPIAIIMSFKRKKWSFLTFLSVFQIYLFLLNPHKTVMFIFLVVVGLSFVDVKKHLKYIIGGTVVLLLLAIQFDLSFVENMFVRRVLFVPAKLNQGYYEVFANIKLYLSYSIFSPFSTYPLNESPAYYVSSNFYNNVASHSNNGILSSGYMNFGIAGVLSNIFLFFLLIRFLKNSVFNQDLIVIFLPTIFLLNSSYLLTALVTHGLWFIIFFAYINRKYR